LAYNLKYVYEAIKSLSHGKKMLKQINYTLIALIAKVDSPSTTSQFVLISPCKTLYKIVSKIIVNRM